MVCNKLFDAKHEADKLFELVRSIDQQLSQGAAIKVLASNDLQHAPIAIFMLK
jgi:hypothetical protein